MSLNKCALPPLRSMSRYHLNSHESSLSFKKHKNSKSLIMLPKLKSLEEQEEELQVQGLDKWRNQKKYRLMNVSKQIDDHMPRKKIVSSPH